MSDNQTVPEPEQDVEGHVQVHGPEGFPGGGPEGVRRADGAAPEPEGLVRETMVKRRVD